MPTMLLCRLCLPIDFRWKFDLLLASEWFNCNWCNFTNNVVVKFAFAIWIMQLMFVVFQVTGEFRSK